jgi:hypothetical protein
MLVINTNGKVAEALKINFQRILEQIARAIPLL